MQILWCFWMLIRHAMVRQIICLSPGKNEGLAALAHLKNSELRLFEQRMYRLESNIEQHHWISDGFKFQHVSTHLGTTNLEFSKFNVRSFWPLRCIPGRNVGSRTAEWSPDLGIGRASGSRSESSANLG